MNIQMAEKVLQKNDYFAETIKKELKNKKIYALNLISSPGSGKTSILEKTLPLLEKYKCAVIEGDICTEQDADRIRHLSIPAVQIETQGGCHLDARMIIKAMEGLELPLNGFLFIENVGNLVCPAGYDLGEHDRVVVLSVTEGDDKPLKYPAVFVTANIVILNKVDLLEYTSFDIGRFYSDINSLNPDAKIFELSCRTGEGIKEWIEWLEKKRENI